MPAREKFALVTQQIRKRKRGSDSFSKSRANATTAMKQRRVQISTSKETKQIREKSESSREDTRVCLPALSARSWRVDFPSLETKKMKCEYEIEERSCDSLFNGNWFGAFAYTHII